MIDVGPVMDHAIEMQKKESKDDKPADNITAPFKNMPELLMWLYSKPLERLDANIHLTRQKFLKIEGKVQE